MSKKSFVEAIDKCNIKKERVNEISGIYGVSIDGTIAKIISYADTEDFFDEERRALSYGEIKNASEELEVDFVKLGLVPVIDAYDNNYVVYILSEKKWAKFNIYEKSIFKKKNIFEEVI